MGVEPSSTRQLDIQVAGPFRKARSSAATLENSFTRSFLKDFCM
jgi:hypothetical protein